MKILIYVLAFIFSFIVFFGFTFPIPEVLGSFLTSKGFSYKLIKGNLFEFEIDEIKFKNVKIDKLNIKNNLVKLEAIINDKHRLEAYPFIKSANISVKNLKLEKYQVKPEIYGNLNANNQIKLESENILIKGKDELFISNYKAGIINNLNLISKIKPESNYNVLKVNITSSYINGMFSGRLFLPLDFSKAYLEGNFSGKVFGSSVNKKIKIKLLKVLKGELKF